MNCANCLQSCLNTNDPNNNNNNNNGSKGVSTEQMFVHEILLDMDKQDEDRLLNGVGAVAAAVATKMDVKTALSIIYKLNVVNELNLDDTEEGVQVGLCFRCSEVLQTLYILFDEFNHHRKEESYLGKKVSQLDRLFSQLQETWTEMASTQAGSQNCDDINNVKLDNYDEDPEVMIVQEKKKAVTINRTKNLLADSSNKNNDGLNEQEQEQLTSVQSSRDDSHPSSDLEKEILKEIKAITVTTSTNENGIIVIDEDPNNNFMDEHELYDPEDDYDDEDNQISENSSMTTAVTRSSDLNYWNHNPDEILMGLTHDTDNSTLFASFPTTKTKLGQNRKFVQGKRAVSPINIPPAHRQQYQPMKKVASKKTTNHDDSEDSDWDPISSSEGMKRKKSKSSGFRGRKPTIQMFDLCPLCPDRPNFVDPSDLSQHWFLTHRSATDTVCQLCSKVFAAPHTLQVHLRAHAGDLRFECPVANCGRLFLTCQRKDIHCKSYHGKMKPRNKKKSSIQGGHVRKEKNFIKIKRPPAPVPMDKGMGRKKKNSVKVYNTCPLCPSHRASFTTPSDLTEHWLRQHRDGLPETACPLCHLVLSTIHSLDRHCRAHSQDRQYFCPAGDCGKTFLTKQHLKTHQSRCHSGQEFDGWGSGHESNSDYDDDDEDVENENEQSASDMEMDNN